MISLWLPRFPTDRWKRERRRSGARAAGEPFATVAKEDGRLAIAAVDGAAGAMGVAPGQSLADARALVPSLEVAGHDPAGDRRALARLSDWCTRYSPWCAPDGCDGVFLDVTGTAHLFGGEEPMLGEICARIARLGFSVRGALADTPGAAWACARFAAADAALVPEGGAREALASLPVAGLRLPGTTAFGLARLGLRRIGDLYDLPRAPLAARFGAQLWRRLDQALGAEAEPISPREPAVPHRAWLAFAEPIVAPDGLARAIRRLLHELCERLQREQMGARRLALALYRVDGSLWQRRLGTARPLYDPEALFRLFALHLERIDPGFGIEAMALAAPLVEPCAPAQAVLGGRGAEIESPDEALADLIECLSNRFDEAALTRLAARESHIPERAQRRLPALGSPGGSGAGFAARRPRPLRLFARPHLIEAVAPVPDDPPLLFRWRHAVHRVRRAEGPERIAPEWWREDAGFRDYYRVEDESGRRFCLYREGPCDEAPRWFLHGLFG